MENQGNNIPMDEIMRLAKSPVAQQLIKTLKAQDPETLKKVIESAKSGDFQQAKSGLSSLIGTEDMQKILKNMGG